MDASCGFGFFAVMLRAPRVYQRAFKARTSTRFVLVRLQEVVRLNEQYANEQKVLNTAMDNVAGYAFATFKTITAAAVTTQACIAICFWLPRRTKIAGLGSIWVV
jgi:hypothetical protein